MDELLKKVWQRQKGLNHALLLVYYYIYQYLCNDLVMIHYIHPTVAGVDRIGKLVFASELYQYPYFKVDLSLP